MVEERPLSLSGTTQPKGPERVDFQPLIGPVLSDGQSTQTECSEEPSRLSETIFFGGWYEEHETAWL